MYVCNGTHAHIVPKMHILCVGLGPKMLLVKILIWPIYSILQYVFAIVLKHSLWINNSYVLLEMNGLSNYHIIDVGTSHFYTN